MDVIERAVSDSYLRDAYRGTNLGAIFEVAVSDSYLLDAFVQIGIAVNP